MNFLIKMAEHSKNVESLVKKEMKDPKELPLHSKERQQKLPTFMEYVDKAVRSKTDEGIHDRQQILYMALALTEEALAQDLRVRSLEIFGKFSVKSKEYEDHQTAFWIQLERMYTIRTTMLRFYHILPPKWGEEVILDNYYFGVPISKEDYEKFVTSPPEWSNLKVMTPEDPVNPKKTIRQEVMDVLLEKYIESLDMEEGARYQALYERKITRRQELEKEDEKWFDTLFKKFLEYVKENKDLIE